MIRIVVGGQINKQEIAEHVKKIMGGNAVVEIRGDLDAALAIQAGTYDYYLGACNTGGGGALAMAIALIGADKCTTVSVPGKVLTDEEIAEAVQNGKKAFGFTAQHANHIVPVLMKEIMKKEGV